MMDPRSASVCSGRAVIVGAVFCLVAAGCATQSWTETEIRHAAERLQSDMAKTTAEARAEIAKAREQNKASYQLIENLQTEADHLQTMLATLSKNLETLNKHIETSLAAQKQQLTAALEGGDRAVKEALLKEHQAAVDALMADFARVETAGQRADELAQVLRKVLVAYTAAGQQGSGK